MPDTVKAVRFRFRFYLILFFAALIVGTVGFMALEGMSFSEALYFIIVTMATVGYGDISPETGPGRVLAVVMIVMGVGTFLGVIANATELILTKRQQQSRMEKLNMVIGLFFSELGTNLLTLFSDADPSQEEIKEVLRVEGDWTAEDFANVRRQLGKKDYELDPDLVSLPDLVQISKGKRAFVVGLLENAAVMEHEAFTDVLWAVFHLIDELEARDDVSSLPPFDRAHIIGDTQRAYGRLVDQWLRYMQHMQRRYPYLFSRAVRQNPFVTKSKNVLKQSEGQND
ncbi:MAG: two pore domain potassium channel family protein [Planctomycetes bacterium]|nr:two pore domain potassium channel family protein [Planctomycetota bacterium]